MANWSNPQLTSTYTNFLAEVKDRDVDLALQFDGTTSTNIPTNAIRWDSSANRWKKWSGSVWGELTATYALTALTLTGSITFEGATDDAYETTLTVVDPTADRTITLPNVTGTVVTTGDSGSVTSTMIADGTIVNADVNASAAIAGSKISPDFGSQNTTTTGTSTAASFIPTGATVPSNGIYLPAANQIGIATNSTQWVRITSTGDVNIKGAGTAGSTQAVSFSGSAPVNSLVVDSSGRLLVGTSTYDGNGVAVIQGVAADATGPGVLDLRRGTTRPAGADTSIGYLRFMSTSQTSANYHYAYIAAFSDGASSSDADIPGRLVFATTADGASSPTERARIDSSGRLLVGATGQGAFTSILTLSYDAGTTKWSTGPYSGNATGFVISANVSYGVYLASTTSTSWATASDERLKTDLEPIENGLLKVDALRAVTGRYAADSDGPRKPFLIAQDVLQVLPEAVDTSNPERYGLAYTEVIPLLVAALKESKARIETLEAKVAALEAA